VKPIYIHRVFDPNSEADRIQAAARTTWRCARCGFEAPAFDAVGKALMEEHLAEHRRGDREEELA
jgi:hypothetical protein